MAAIDITQHDHLTVLKVLESLTLSGLSETQARECINEMLNSGILFRERLASDQADQESPNVAAPAGYERPDFGPFTSNLIAHAIRELELSGEDPAFAQSLISAVACFASYPGHSGGSSDIGKWILGKLLNFENLSPLTDNPEEWEDRSDMSGYPFWQNKRNSKAFSRDGGKTYRLLNSDVDVVSLHAE